VAKRKTFN